MDRSSYAFDCLAAAGFAVMSPAVAYSLRPDLWACVQDCARTLGAKAEIPGTLRMTAVLDGVGQVPVLTRSTDQLAKRIEWVTGHKVSDLRPARPEPVAPEVPSHLSQEKAAKEAERMARVRKLAGEALPTHDCEFRREIVAARRELGMPEAA